MRGDVKGTFAAWIAATNDFAVGSRPGRTRGRVLHFVQFIFLFFIDAAMGNGHKSPEHFLRRLSGKERHAHRRKFP